MSQVKLDVAMIGDRFAPAHVVRYALPVLQSVIATYANVHSVDAV